MRPEPPGFAGGFNSPVRWSIVSGTTDTCSPEIRKRALRRVLDHQGQQESRWSAITMENLGSSRSAGICRLPRPPVTIIWPSGSIRNGSRTGPGVMANRGPRSSVFSRPISKPTASARSGARCAGRDSTWPSKASFAARKSRPCVPTRPSLPAGDGEAPGPRAGPEHAVGARFHLCRHAGRLRPCGVGHRRLRAPPCRMARQPHGPCRIRPECPARGRSSTTAASGMVHRSDRGAHDLSIK